jgi:biopolymer transport protein ExbD
MIDVIFLLLLFFAIMTSFEASAKVRVDVPRPEHSQARRSDSAKQVVINCELADPNRPTAGALYRIAADAPQPLAVISERLAAAQQANPRLAVVIRADRRLPYAHVRAAMRTAAENDIQILNVSAIRDLEH